MKKIKTLISVSIVVFSLLIVNMFSASAATYFSDGNFTFLRNGDDTITIVSYDLLDGNMVVPESIFGDTVVATKMLAFYNNDYIVTASFPNTLTTLGDSAFNEASNLTTVTIPESCVNLGAGALQNCPSLKNVTINSKMTVINNQVFYNDKSLEKIELPETVASIGSFAFSDCTSLTYVNIPKATTSIADNAFRNCPNLTIHGYADSYAQQYALEKGIAFEVIPEYEIGDVNLDGIINVNDATLVQRYSANFDTLTEQQLALADVNADGTVNVNDATEIQKVIVSKA